MKQTQFERVRTWATVRGLYEKGDSKTQFVKLIEEIGETGRAILKSDEPEIKDGLGDAFVVLVNLAHLCGYRLEDCIEESLQVIESRTGKMVDGVFVKDE
jgi:NTP pyrophosphatase (non-canonical NTP hydrolase)|tara:strand:+ start:268 stop:567 length:300 start_codon:yes stop_codon:yes gene_type:complete